MEEDTEEDTEEDMEVEMEVDMEDTTPGVAACPERA